MYYEEQLIDGKWYYKDTPDGEWKLIEYEWLAKKYELKKLELAQLKEELNAVSKTC